MADCVEGADGRRNRILPVGGPGPAVTPRERGEMLFELAGRRPRFRRLPSALFDVARGGLRLASLVAPGLKEKAELARIGRYYATEPMIVRDPGTGRYDADATPEFGEQTLRDFYRRALTEGLEGHALGEQGIF